MTLLQLEHPKLLMRSSRFGFPKSLRFQIVSRSLLVLAALLLLIGVFQYVFMQQFVYKNKAQTIQHQMLSLPYDAWNLSDDKSDDASDGGGGGKGKIPIVLMPDSTLSYISPSGEVTVISGGHADTTSAVQLSSEQYTAAMQRGTGGVDYRVANNEQGEEQLLVLQPLYNHGKQLGLIQLSTSTKQLKDVLVQQLTTFLGLSFLALLAGLLAFLPVLRKTLLPLSKMVTTVERIDAGNLNERFPIHQGQAEVDRLAVSFNGMLERLGASFEAEKEAKERMRRFVADASHELRTPLTSIHGFLEILLRGAVKQPEQMNKVLASMHGESVRINKLVQDLLLLAKLDRSPELMLKKADLRDIIGDMEPQLRLLADGRELELNVSDGSECVCEPDKIKQVILNLAHNAVQHTDPVSGRVVVSAYATANGDAGLSVSDNGPGIAEEHLPHLFERFYRSDSSRTRMYGGAGLGLSISKSIVEAHGGTIGVESTLGVGRKFTVCLPSWE
ncbi:sensor histidine kinase [Paenibacillus chartarius]|uniref:histidine kinase n=1 Tax=Paenibacillus chartarius TaxID=747481 RepID=A0ABV6DL55_9BACL